MSDISSVGALLAIEIDPTEQMPSLEPLGREQAQQRERAREQQRERR